jgi:hypothetical protein
MRSGGAADHQPVKGARPQRVAGYVKGMLVRGALKINEGKQYGFGTGLLKGREQDQ